jgi:hypothetical protein
MLENVTHHFKNNKFGINNFLFILILTLPSEKYKELENRHHCILKLLSAQKLIQIMKEQYFIALEIELCVVVSKTFHTESVTPIHSFLPLCTLLTTHCLCGLAFFSEGRILLIKCNSVRRSTVLPKECQPGTLRSSTLAYFINSPSTN